MGRITEAVLRGYLPQLGHDNVIFLYGPRLWPTRWNLLLHYIMNVEFLRYRLLGQAPRFCKLRWKSS